MQQSWLVRVRPALAATLALALGGCQLDEALRGDRWTWIWLVVPLLGLGLAGFVVVHYRRKAQMEAWDLRMSPGEPSAKRIVLQTIFAVGTIAVLFVVYNFTLGEMDPTQRLMNVGLWLLGSILGTAAALWVGLKSAEPRGTLPGPAPVGRR